MLDITEIKTLICTGNLGNTEPTLESLSAWIPKDGDMSYVGRQPEQQQSSRSTVNGAAVLSYDVIAIGMQEATFSVSTGYSISGGPQAVGNLVDMGTGVLKKMLKEQLPGYKIVVEFQRGQMRLFVFVKTQLVSGVSEVSIAAQNTGIGGILFNKGGIVATFNLFGTRISFLSAHLQAHEGAANYTRRCASMKEILSGANVNCGKGSKKHLKLYDVTIPSHYMFVMGDLNFRTDFDKTNKTVTEEDVEVADTIEENEVGEIPAENFDAAMKLVKEKNWKALMAVDELSYALDNQHTLVGFETPPCDFNPTFKVEKKTEGFVYKNQRTPSYTDRILYKTMKGLEKFIQVLHYEPCPDYITSDHKPIRGAFRLVPVSPVMLSVARRSSLKRSSTSARIAAKLFQKKIQFKIKLSNMKCTDVPAMDPNGLADPYIMLVLTSTSLHKDRKRNGVLQTSHMRKWPRSSTVLRNRNPDFGDETLEISVQASTESNLLGETLCITVMDYDLASGDDLIGTVSLNLHQLYTKAYRNSLQASRIEETIVKNAMPRGSFKCDIEALSNDQ